MRQRRRLAAQKAAGIPSVLAAFRPRPFPKLVKSRILEIAWRDVAVCVILQ